MQLDSKIPVFVFPHSITFILEDRSSHKQILSLYNPYDYPIKYRVLSTAPEKYIVNTPEGVILSHHRADVVVRLNDAKISNCEIIDKFRIQMQDKINRKILGKQDITAVLKSQVHSSRSITPEKDNFQIMPIAQGLSGQRSALPNNQSSQDVASSPNYVILTIAIVCISGLLLPTEKEGEPPSRFQISVSLKLVFSYVLGLVTMVILRTQ